MLQLTTTGTTKIDITTDNTNFRELLSQSKASDSYLKKKKSETSANEIPQGVKFDPGLDPRTNIGEDNSLWKNCTYVSGTCTSAQLIN